MADLKIFENPAFGQVRTVEREGEPWFVGKDVAQALGYSNTRDALDRHVDDEDKNTVVNPDGNRGNPNMIIINESGLYSLVLSSKLPTAKAFKRWITSEVIPSIRKHGAYITPDTLEQMIADPDTTIRLLTTLKEERLARAQLETENAQQKQLLAEYSPKASYYDVVLQTPDALSISQIAKDYGKSAKWLNQQLHEMGVQYNQGGVWLLYQQYAEQGYTRSKTHTYSGDDGMQHSRLHTYWTQKGRLFIYETLKARGILPLIEAEKGACTL